MKEKVSTDTDCQLHHSPAETCGATDTAPGGSAGGLVEGHHEPPPRGCDPAFYVGLPRSDARRLDRVRRRFGLEFPHEAVTLVAGMALARILRIAPATMGRYAGKLNAIYRPRRRAMAVGRPSERSRPSGIIFASIDAPFAEAVRRAAKALGLRIDDANAELVRLGLAAFEAAGPEIDTVIDAHDTALAEWGAEG